MSTTTTRMTRLPLHHSLQEARRVINRVRIPAEHRDSTSVQAWSNGREQGYAIFVTDGPVEAWRYILVAQQRNSNEIMVRVVPSRECDISTNMPSEEAWRLYPPRYFRHRDYDGAARFITDAITGATR